MDGNGKETKKSNRQEVKQKKGQDGISREQEGRPVLKEAGPAARKKAGEKTAKKQGGVGPKKKKAVRAKERTGTEGPSGQKEAFKPRVVPGGKDAAASKADSGGKKVSGAEKVFDVKKDSGGETVLHSEKTPDVPKASVPEEAAGPEKNALGKKSGKTERESGKGKKEKGKKEREKKQKRKGTAAKKKSGGKKPSGSKAGESEKNEKTAKTKKAVKSPEETKPSGTSSQETEKKNAAVKPGNTGKSGKPGLRLVKNGDLPVKEEKTPEKKTEKKKTHQKPKTEKGKDRDTYQERMGFGEWFAQHKSLVIIGLMVFAFFSLLFGIYRYITTAYEVTTVYVDGNVHYTNEEVMDMVMGGRYGNNSLYLAMKYRDKGIEGVPFVEKMDVDILTPNTIRISVYEKALAGYVEYLGRYMYFDRDGTVVESSENRTSGIPQVTGLKFDYVVLNELLPVENDEIFKRILDITQLLNKYELMADKIFFDSSYDLTLFFDDIRVTLGSDSSIDQKIIRLKNILPNLEGKKGTLEMENYTEDTKNITFRQE